jgi:hypothetical protein
MSIDYIGIIKRAWDILIKNVPIIAVLLIVFILLEVVRTITVNLFEPGIIKFIVSIIFLMAHVFLTVGSIKIVLNLVDGKPAKVDQLWAYPQYFVNALIVVLAVSGIMLIVNLLAVMGIALPLLGILSLIVILISVYLLIRLWFSLYYVVDKEMNGVDALKASWNKTEGNTLNLLIFLLIIIALNILGALVLLVGLLVTIPLSYIAVALLYRKFQSA